MALYKFYKILASIDRNRKGHIDWYSNDVLKRNINRLAQQVGATTDSNLQIVAQVARILWNELPQEPPTEKPKKPNSRQELVRCHWIVFMQFVIYREVHRYDILLPPNRSDNLTRSNLFEYGRTVGDEPPESFFRRYRNTETGNYLVWYRGLVTFTHRQVKSKLRDIICQLPGCGTFGSKNLGVLRDASPSSVKKALIHYGYKSTDLEGTDGDGDARLLLVLDQTFREVGNAIILPNGHRLRIDLWTDANFQQVTDRWQQLTSELPPFQSQKLLTATTPQRLEFLGDCVSRFLDPPTSSINVPIANEDGNTFTLEDFISSPWQEDPDETSVIGRLIKEYLESVDILKYRILFFKYGLLDPTYQLTTKTQIEARTRKFSATQTDVAIELSYADNTPVHYHLGGIYRASRDILSTEFAESAAGKSRIVETAISVYYIELMESYLNSAIESLSPADRKLLPEVYRDIEQIEAVELHPIHQFLIDDVGRQILERLNLPQFAPDGQAVEAIDNWIQSQLSQRV
jgi:hypothetical protein